MNKVNLSLVISISTLFFSIYTYLIFLPEAQARLIFSENSITVTKQENSIKIVPTIKNIGKFSAHSVHFSLYLMNQDKDLAVVKLFDDSLAQDIESDEQATFGSISFSNDTSIVRSIVLYQLTYTDSLTRRQVMKVGSYNIAYPPVVEGKNVTTLLGSDFKFVREKMTAYLYSHPNESNKSLLDFFDTVN